MKRNTPVFLLDCENRSQEGVLKSFGKRNILVYAFSSVPNNPAFYSRYIHKKFISPSDQENTNYIKFLIDFPERGILIPSTDASVSILSEYESILCDEGYLLNVPEYSKLNVGFDKWQCYKFALKTGIPVIQTELINNYNSLETTITKLGYPLILKGTKLAGGKNIKITSINEGNMAYKEMVRIVSSSENKHLKSDIIAQKFITHRMSDLWSCECVYSVKSEPLGFITVQKIRPNISKNGSYGSRLYAGINTNNNEVKELTEKLLSSLTWKGFAHVEWIYDKKTEKYLLTEINPRLPGYSNFHTKTGFEMAYFYYADLLNINFNIPKIPNALYFESLRFPGDITGGVFSIINGKLKLTSFIKSYLRIFTFKYKVVFDVCVPSDPMFTLRHWYLIIKRIFQRSFRKNND